MNRGSDSSYCKGRQRDGPVIACDIFERCSQGACIKAFNNECDYLCDEAGYDIYFCQNEVCPSNAEEMALDEGDCSHYGKRCCCTD
jgi:hypothetical protein